MELLRNEYPRGGSRKGSRLRDSGKGIMNGTITAYTLQTIR